MNLGFKNELTISINTNKKSELQWVITLEFKSESAMPINPGNKSELMI